jgi:hypothetical protein
MNLGRRRSRRFNVWYQKQFGKAKRRERRAPLSKNPALDPAGNLLLKLFAARAEGIR